MKNLDDYFCDWESHYLGFGYGSGEEHILPALKRFVGAIPMDKGYDYKALESACTPTVAWLLINLFGHADLIEYGSSPRYAWLTPHGKALKEYLDSKTIADLEYVMGRDYDRYCFPDHCNCDGPMCSNPFWRTLHARTTNKAP